jgi:hypothetical protein
MLHFLYESEYSLPPKENDQEANTLAAYRADLQFHIRVHNTGVKFDVFKLRQYAAGRFASEATKLTVLQSSSILSKRSTAPPTLLPVSSSGTKHRI